MAFIVANDFVGKDKSLIDKLNSLYFALGEIATIAKDTLNVTDPHIDTILMARTWLDLLIEATEDLEASDAEAYNYLEENSIVDATEFDDPNDYEDQWDEEPEPWDDPDAWDGSDWVDDDFPSATELLGSDE